MVSIVHLTREGETFEDPERYRRLVGKLNYLTVTCHNIAHLIRILRILRDIEDQFMSSPIVDHWAAVEQILCYLK